MLFPELHTSLLFESMQNVCFCRFLWSAFLVKILNIKFEPVACPVLDHAPCDNIPVFHRKMQKQLSISE